MWLIRKAGTQENPEVGSARRGEPMATGPTQRVGDNAFHLPVFLIQFSPGRIRTLKRYLYSRRNAGVWIKGQL
jgi:hypothetical protein